jgi:predicted N-acetyltransferase YhbS
MSVDTLGLSAIHFNRSLRQLREAGMVAFRDGFVAFDDYQKLATFARFDPTYREQLAPLLP